MKRFAFAFVLILAGFLISKPAAAQVSGVAINASTGVVLLGSPAGAANCKAATTGAIRYNSTTPAIEFCNGTTWKQLYQVQSTPVITAPAGSGYFVLTSGTYTGNLGGLAGANSTCLTELTTNTGWQGYSTANSNGQLIASKVKAFICTGTNGSNTCNNLMPLTTYYFANAGSGAAGGASFTTDSSGIGPNDNNDWAAANYFSGSYAYYSNRAQTSSTAWATTPYSSSAAGSCTDYTSTATSAVVGVAASTIASRWVAYGNGCSQSIYLICFVNP